MERIFKVVFREWAAKVDEGRKRRNKIGYRLSGEPKLIDASGIC